MIPHVAQALNTLPPLADEITCHLAFDPNCNNLSLILSGITNWLIAIAATIFFFMFVYGGLKYLTASGNDTETKAAKNTILFAIIGLINIIGSWAVVKFLLGELL